MGGAKDEDGRKCGWKNLKVKCDESKTYHRAQGKAVKRVDKSKAEVTSTDISQGKLTMKREKIVSPRESFKSEEKKAEGSNGYVFARASSYGAIQRLDPEPARVQETAKTKKEPKYRKRVDKDKNGGDKTDKCVANLNDQGELNVIEKPGNLHGYRSKCELGRE